MFYAVTFVQNWKKLIKEKKEKNMVNDYIVCSYSCILHTHTILSSLRYAHASNYQNCETVYSFQICYCHKELDFTCRGVPKSASGD